MNLFTNDTALARALRTVLQSFIGFVVGLALTVWNVPGVPLAVQNYIQPYEMQLLLWLGVPTVVFSGVIAYFSNKWREEKPEPTEEPPSVPVAETGVPQQ